MVGRLDVRYGVVHVADYLMTRVSVTAPQNSIGPRRYSLLGTRIVPDKKL